MDSVSSGPGGDEDFLVPVSALNHYLFCERRCALIHSEGVFPENRYTEEGRQAHERVDEPGFRERRGCRTVRALPLFSDRYGLTGRADAVEFWPGDGPGEPRPVDYKRGRASRWENDHVQLCAQALCLEEMFGCEVREGSIYHVSSRRRTRVPMTLELRARTIEAIGATRELLASGRIPPPVFRARCHGCSLEPVCIPQQSGERDSFTRYMRELFQPREDT